MPDNNYILAFEAANFNCSVAVIKCYESCPAETVFFEEIKERQGQGTYLMPLIQKGLKQAGISFSALKAIAVTTGPGSFTGVRIALAAAKGFQIAMLVPVIGFNSFEVAASAVINHKLQDLPILVVLESRRTELFCQLFSSAGAALKPPAMLLPESIYEYAPFPLFVTGNGQQHLPDSLREIYNRAEPDMFDARHVAGTFIGQARTNTLVKSELLPFYLRAPDINLSARK